MNFSCESCQRRYTLADERILERAVRVRCKTCGTLRTLGPLRAPPEPDASGERTRVAPLGDLERLKAQAGARTGDETPWDGEATRVVTDAAAGERWFAMIKGKQDGPFDLSALAAKVAGGEVQPRTYVWKNGMADWKRASDVPALAPLFERSPAAARSDVATEPQRPHSGKVRGVRPPERTDADAAPVTASQILESEDLQRALGRRPTAELNAAELFGGLELSKVARMPLPPLTDLLEESAAAPAPARDEAADAIRTQPTRPAVPRPGSTRARPVSRRRALNPSAPMKAAIAVAVVLLVTVSGLAAASSVGLIRLEVGAVDAASGAPVNVPLLSSEGWQAFTARLAGETPRIRTAGPGAPTPVPAPTHPAAPAVAQPAPP